jgi:hypothetical protein
VRVLASTFLPSYLTGVPRFATVLTRFLNSGDPGSFSLNLGGFLGLIREVICASDSSLDGSSMITPSSMIGAAAATGAFSGSLSIFLKSLLGDLVLIYGFLGGFGGKYLVDMVGLTDLRC